MNIKSILKQINSSIQAKLIGMFAMILFAFILFAALYYPGREKRQSLESVQLQVSTLTDMLAFSVGSALSESNFALIQTAFDWTTQDENVIYVSIRDETGSSLVEHNPNDIKIDEAKIQEAGGSYKDDEQVYSSAAIVYDNQTYGTIFLIYSLSDINARIQSGFLVSLLLNLSMFAIGIGIIFILSKRFTGQIISLRDTAREISSGNLKTEINIKSEDEVGELAEAFRKMITDLDRGNKELKREKRSVEKKVEEAVEISEKEKRYLNNNVEKMLAEMTRFAQGDLAIHLTSDRDDDIARLFNGFNDAVKNIKNTISEVQSSISATAKAASEIQTGTMDLSKAAQDQTQQTIEIAGAVEQMANTISENTKNTTSAAEVAKKSGKQAKDGGQVVVDTISGMDKISSVVSKSAVTVQALGRSSKEIGEIIEVIDEIADQTNLLALNAAIEAARAGEQGRGFAVVADEVRKLAERTSNATREIADMIRQIQTETESAVKSMQEVTGEVDKGKKLVDQAGKSLEDIIANSDHVIDIITQVATASEEQSATSEEISKTIDAISRIIETFATGNEQISGSAQQLLELMQKTQSLVDHFQLDASGPNASRPQVTTVDYGFIAETNHKEVEDEAHLDDHIDLADF